MSPMHPTTRVHPARALARTENAALDAARGIDAILSGLQTALNYAEAAPDMDDIAHALTYNRALLESVQDNLRQLEARVAGLRSETKEEN